MGAEVLLHVFAGDCVVEHILALQSLQEAVYQAVGNYKLEEAIARVEEWIVCVLLRKTAVRRIGTDVEPE